MVFQARLSQHVLNLLEQKLSSHQQNASFEQPQELWILKIRRELRNSQMNTVLRT